MLFLLIIFGSSIFVSSAILHIRRRAFEKKFAELTEKRQRRLLMAQILSFSRSRRSSNLDGHEAAVASGAIRGRPIHDAPADAEYMASFQSPERGRRRPTEAWDSTKRARDEANEEQNATHIRFEDCLPAVEHSDSRTRTIRRNRSSSFFEGRGVGARGLDNHPRHTVPLDYNLQSDDGDVENDVSPSEEPSKMQKYIRSVNGYIGRNSQFHHLSEKERKKLGGIEYDAICLLSWLVPLYFILFQLFGALGVGAWIQVNRPNTTLENGESLPVISKSAGEDLSNQPTGLNPFWVGAFFAVSAFNNSGMALLDANATALQTSYYCLLTLSFLILAGNTCFPPFLRLVLWSMKLLTPKSPAWQVRRRTLEFCLDHPRRVYTNLFPMEETLWLVVSVIVLNSIDWIAFELLNLGNPVTEAIPPHFRVLDGLFQAFAVRSGGFCESALNLLPRCFELLH